MKKRAALAGRVVGHADAGGGDSYAVGGAGVVGDGYEGGHGAWVLVAAEVALPLAVAAGVHGATLYNREVVAAVVRDQCGLAPLHQARHLRAGLTEEAAGAVGLDEASRPTDDDAIGVAAVVRPPGGLHPADGADAGGGAAADDGVDS